MQGVVNKLNCHSCYNACLLHTAFSTRLDSTILSATCLLYSLSIVDFSDSQEQVRSGDASATELFELGAVMLRRKVYPAATKFLLQAIEKWDGDDQDLAQVWHHLYFFKLLKHLWFDFSIPSMIDKMCISIHVSIAHFMVNLVTYPFYISSCLQCIITGL